LRATRGKVTRRIARVRALANTAPSRPAMPYSSWRLLLIYAGLALEQDDLVHEEAPRVADGEARDAKERR
jgi:hypothetical protein